LAKLLDEETQILIVLHEVKGFHVVILLITAASYI